MMLFRALGLMVLLASCGGGSNLRLGVVPGQSRAVAEDDLRSTKYCRHEAREKRTQSYVRCGVKGLELGESWIVIDYSPSGSVARVRRMEHYSDHKSATKRWSALIGERRAQLGEESQEARSRLADHGEAPLGAVAWKAWFSKGLDQVIGVYLVKPDDPREPQVVEVVRWDRAED